MTAIGWSADRIGRWSANEIVKLFEEHSSVNLVQYWDSKNHGSHRQNSLDKRDQIYCQKTAAKDHQEGMGRAHGDILPKKDIKEALESRYLIMRKADMNADNSFLQI